MTLPARARRAAPAMVALVAAAALLVPAPAQGATSVGQTSTPNATCTGSPDGEFFTSVRSDGTTNAMPSDGVITSWSFQSGAGALQLVLRVFRSAPADSWFVVGDGGDLQTFSSPGLHTFPTRVPVRQGDIAGIRITGSGDCGNQTGNPADVYRVRGGAATPLGGTASFLSSVTVRIDISVSLEPDADLDGYGDETQDGCPVSAASQGVCTETTITKKPKSGSHSPKSKLKFVSNIAGATFSCTLDKKKAKACTSPAKYTCLKPGKHTFAVVATSPFGYADPTPATKRFRVAADRHGC